jgi:hypothetical protein
MKKQFLILNGFLSVMVILLLLGVAVNHQAGGMLQGRPTPVADGVPLPPPTQPPPDNSTRISADGVPLPPPTQPPPDFTMVSAANGVPLPPPTQPPPDVTFV